MLTLSSQWAASLDISCNRALHDKGYYNIPTVTASCEQSTIFIYMSFFVYKCEEGGVQNI